MKLFSEPRCALVIALLTAAVFMVSTAAQTPQTSQSEAGRPTAPPPGTLPAPTNLKVLPKDLTGRQVHDIMKQWAGFLGVRCSSCHAEDAEKLGPDGQPQLEFADDSKPMKNVARLMYTMTENINSGYIAKVEGSGMPVTCGTCHRGRMSPEPFDAHPAAMPPALKAFLEGEKKSQQ